MGLFSYEPGGKFHVRITDEDFSEARARLKGNPASLTDFPVPDDLAAFNASDLPVTEIIASFLGAYYLAELASSIDEADAFDNIEITRADQLAYSKFVSAFNAKLAGKDARAQQQRGFKDGGELAAVLVTEASRALFKGVLRVATGKPEAVRLLEKYFLKYMCGDSVAARRYYLDFAVRFGARDEAVIAIAQHIRGQMWMAEFARKNRNLIPQARVARVGRPVAGIPDSETAVASVEPLATSRLDAQGPAASLPRRESDQALGSITGSVWNQYGDPLAAKPTSGPP